MIFSDRGVNTLGGSSDPLIGDAAYQFWVLGDREPFRS